MALLLTSPHSTPPLGVLISRLGREVPLNRSNPHDRFIPRFRLYVVESISQFYICLPLARSLYIQRLVTERIRSPKGQSNTSRSIKKVLPPGCLLFQQLNRNCDDFSVYFYHHKLIKEVWLRKISTIEIIPCKNFKGTRAIL